MSLHVLRLLTVSATCWLFVSGIAAQEATDAVSGNDADSPWKTPSEQADSAVADWASQALKTEPQSTTGKLQAPQEPLPAVEIVPVENQVEISSSNDPASRYSQASMPANSSPVMSNPTASNPVAPSQVSFAKQQEPAIRYNPNDQPTSNNPLRSGSVSSPSYVREPAPLSAAERAFASPKQSQPSQAATQPPAYTPNLAAQTAFNEPLRQPTQSQPTNEPSAFNQTIESNARPITPIAPIKNELQSRNPQGERSVLASRQSINSLSSNDQSSWNDDSSSQSQSNLGGSTAAGSELAESTFESAGASGSYSMSSDALETNRLGTGQPGDARLEGPQSPALKIEKRGPAEARVGQPCRFVVTVRNTGNQVAENVVLRDEVPAGARLIETVPTASQEADQIIWKLGALAPGEQRSVELRVSPERQGPLGSVATVSFDASASAKTICTKPELAIRLSAPAKVLVGKKQPLKVEIHNPGTGAATNVVLVEEVPQNMRHEAGPSLEFEVGSLAPGETRQLDLMLTAEQAGSVVNRLTASADGNLRVEQTVAFEVVAPSLTLALDGPKRRYLERPASYTVNIDNPGSAPAKDVRIVTQLPSGMKFVSANNLGEYDAETHSVYWSLAELPEGERGAVKLTALPVTAGEHTLRVQGEADNGLKTSESQNIVVEGVVSLAFDVRDRQDPIEIGSDAVYDVIVTNEGTKPATAVRVTVDAPAGMEVVDAQGKVEHRVAEGRVVFAPIPTLKPGEKFPYRIRLRGIQAGDQRVSVAVESDDLQQPIRREESTRVFGDE